MSTKYIGIVIKKEILDMLRDKRTIITGILLPIILYPLMFGIMGSAVSGMEEEVLNDTTIAISREVSSSEDVMDILNNEIFLDAEGIKLVPSDDPVKALEDGDVKLILDATSTNGGDSVELKLYFDESKMASTNSQSYVSGIISKYNALELNRRLADLGIDLAELYAVNLSVENVSVLTGEVNEVGSGGLYMSMVLPMMLVIFLSSGSMAAAVDMFAGEKERKTFEPLLTTRAGRLPVLLGKFISTNIFGIGTTLMMVIGMGVGYILFPEMLTMGIEEVTLKLPPVIIILCILLVLLLTLIYSGIHVTISTWSRTTKEASSYSTFVMLGGMLPAFATMYMQAGDVKTWMMTVPVLNVIGALKMILGGVIRYDLIGIAILSSGVFLLVVLVFTLRMFKKESVMFRM